MAGEILTEREVENMAAEKKREETEKAVDAPGNAICGWICKGCMPHTCVGLPGRLGPKHSGPMATCAAKQVCSSAN